MAVIMLGGSIPGMAPNEVSGLTAWFSSSSGVYNDAGSTLATDGQSVQQWNDLSGGGNHLSQGTAGDRPLYETAEINGYPVVRFDGSDDRMATTAQLTTLITDSACTIMVAAKISSVATNSANPYDNDAIIADSGGRLGISFRTAGNKSGAFNNDGTTDEATSTTDTSGAWYVYTYHHAGGSLYLGLNDTRTASMATTLSGNLTTLTTVLRVCSNYDETLRVAADVAEIAVYNVAVSESNRQQLERRFAYKYGITLSY